MPCRRVWKSFDEPLEFYRHQRNKGISVPIALGYSKAYEGLSILYAIPSFSDLAYQICQFVWNKVILNSLFCVGKSSCKMTIKFLTACLPTIVSQTGPKDPLEQYKYIIQWMIDHTPNYIQILSTCCASSTCTAYTTSVCVPYRLYLLKA